MLWYILNGLYLILWSVLLVDCLKRRHFFPIFGRSKGTKIFWILTFVLFNPLLTFLYIIFLILLLHPKVNKNSKSVVYGSVAAVIYTCVIAVLFNLPLGMLEKKPSVILSSSENQSLKENSSFLNFKENIALGYLNTDNKIQTLGSASPGENLRISLRNVMIVCQSSNPMLERAVRDFQKSLLKLPYIDEVSYYSYETFPKKGSLLPDIFITMAMPEFSENKFLHGRQIKALIKWKAGSSMFEEIYNLPDNQNNNPMVQFNITSEIRYDSTMAGIESPGAEYKLEAKNISNEMTKAISKQLENFLGNYEELPELPDYLFGNYTEPPKFSFLKEKSAVQLFSGNGLLKDNYTIWTFKDKQEISEALNEYSDAMKNMGWEEQIRGDDYLCMHKDSERMYIFRQSNKDFFAGPVPKDTSPQNSMIAHYESIFSDERLEKAIDELVKNNVDKNTLPIFERYFKTPQQKELLYSLVENVSASTLKEHND